MVEKPEYPSRSQEDHPENYVILGRVSKIEAARYFYFVRGEQVEQAGQPENYRWDDFVEIGLVANVVFCFGHNNYCV